MDHVAIDLNFGIPKQLHDLFVDEKIISMSSKKPTAALDSVIHCNLKPYIM